MFKPHPAPKIHHPCGVSDCKCPTTKQLVSQFPHKRTYEVQTDEYKCGPVSIINALHFTGKVAGPALRRAIVTRCKTVPIHADGFRGTKPDDMGRMVRLLWPECQHFIGIRECKRALRTPRFQGFIVLYSGFRQNKKQYYHYTFTYKPREDPTKYITQNDGSDQELMWTLQTYATEHFSIEGATPIQFPQIWAVV